MKYTTKEQASLFIQYGIDQNTSDLGLVEEDFVDEDTGELISMSKVELSGGGNCPLWSQSRLESFIPSRVFDDKYITTNYHHITVWECIDDATSGVFLKFDKDNYFENLVDLILWLLTNQYIKYDFE